MTPFFILSFIAGVLTILAPCILPLLPVIVGRSVSDATLSKRRVFVVILSLGLSVILFTILLKASTLFINIPQDFWKYLSGGIIFIFGLITLFPTLWENLSFTSKMNQESNKVLMTGYQKNNIWGDIIVGASLGPIFSACSPTYFLILATVLPVSPALGMFYLLTYTFGLCLALLIVAILGQKIMTKLNIASDSHGWFKRTLGVIFILVAIGILTGYDKKLQILILDSGFFDVTKLEQTLLDRNTTQSKANNPAIETTNAVTTEKDTSTTNTVKTTKTIKNNLLTIAQKNKKYILAPDLSSIDGYINTDGKPITISEFKGKKVVLVDIWTYSCINCRRTIPYLNDWYKKYKDEGLVIIGLHDPEFSFERVLGNVQKAVADFDIKYPVVLDNEFSTWNAFKNSFWPRKYLIDVDGYIVYDHAGEGEYDVTEAKIQEALKERNAKLNTNINITTGMSDPAGKIVVDSGKVGSPEIYFGSRRNEHLSNGNVGVATTQDLKIPTEIKSNSLYLGGIWNFTPEYSENSGDASVVFKYNTKNVYMVASSKDGANVEVYVDGKLISTVNIKDEKLYTIVSGADYGEHTLELRIKNSTIDAFTFTFG
ncbi:MAG: cytochrome c biogenesis protein CcdA [bacterium]